ncbi:MAG: YlxR family protein [Streptococcaceae bacterium]|nr:YlxR family protein [Streptococcaceae bacterium]
MQKKIALRKSVVSNQQFPKKELVRIAKTKDGVVSIDPTGKAAGRGAYIGLDPEEVLLSKKKKILDRVLNAELTDEFYQELYDYVEHKKARQELFKDDL